MILVKCSYFITFTEMSVLSIPTIQAFQYTLHKKNNDNFNSFGTERFSKYILQ